MPNIDFLVMPCNSDQIRVLTSPFESSTTELFLYGTICIGVAILNEMTQSLSICVDQLKLANAKSYWFLKQEKHHMEFQIPIFKIATNGCPWIASSFCSEIQ